MLQCSPPPNMPGVVGTGPAPQAGTSLPGPQPRAHTQRPSSSNGGDQPPPRLGTSGCGQQSWRKPSTSHPSPPSTAAASHPHQGHTWQRAEPSKPLGPTRTQQAFQWSPMSRGVTRHGHPTKKVLVLRLSPSWGKKRAAGFNCTHFHSSITSCIFLFLLLLQQEAEGWQKDARCRGMRSNLFSKFFHFSNPLPASPTLRQRRSRPPCPRAASSATGPPTAKPSGREKPPGRKNLVLKIFSVSMAKKS